MRRFCAVLLIASIALVSCASLRLSIPSTGPQGEEDSPPAGWVTTVIDDAGHPVNSTDLSYDSASTTFTVGVNGGRISSTIDSFGAWTYTVPTTGDFSITARIKTATQIAGVNSKSGIMLREALTVGSKMTFGTVYGLNGTLVDVRTATDGAIDTGYFEGVQVTLSECFKIEVDRDINSAKTFQKADATDCSTGTYTEIDQSVETWIGTTQNIYAMLATTPQDHANAGLNATTTFDQVVVSTASITHTPGDVDFNPASYEISEESTPVTLTVTRTGDGSGACSLDYVVNDGSAIAGTDYTDTSGTLSWSDTEIGDKTFNVTIIDRNGTVEGNRQFSSVLTKNSCPNDDLNASIATVTITDADVATSWSANTHTYSSLVDPIAGYGFDWSTYLSGPPTIEIYEINNLNTSGAGSFNGCVTGTSGGTLRACVCSVSGTVTYATGTRFAADRDNLIVLGQSCPAPGLYLKGPTVVSRATRSAIMHIGCLSDGNTQATGTCFEINGKDGDTDIVLLNTGVAFGSDGGIDVINAFDRISVMHSMITYPTDFITGSFGSLLGAGDGAEDHILFSRNLINHSNGRQPSINGGQKNAIYNNIFYNAVNNFSFVSKGGGATFDTNWEGNLCVDGTDSPDGSDCMLYRDTAVAGTRVYLADNRAYGFTWNDSSQTNFILDSSGGNVTTQGSRISGVHPAGVTVTTFPATDQGRLDLMRLICRGLGVQPRYRIAFFQRNCDELENIFDGTGATGSQISVVGDHPDGYPTIPQNSCDLTIADDCGTGKPALPVSPSVAELLTYITSTYCAVMPVGYTGC